MRIVDITEAIANDIEKKILGDWKHEGYVDCFTYETIHITIDGKKVPNYGAGGGVMVTHYEEHGFNVTAEKMPDKCSVCYFADKDVRCCEARKWIGIIAGKERNCRMPLCPLVNEGEYLSRHK